MMLSLQQHVQQHATTAVIISLDKRVRTAGQQMFGPDRPSAGAGNVLMDDAVDEKPIHACTNLYMPVHVYTNLCMPVHAYTCLSRESRITCTKRNKSVEQTAGSHGADWHVFAFLAISTRR